MNTPARTLSPRIARTLCLHYLRAPGSPPRRLALEPDALRAMLARERDEGRTPAPATAFLADDPPGPDRFVLTFDDAHRSLLELAAPLLRALDVPATVFVPTAYVGQSDEFLTWDELRALRDLGWTIGSHGAHHPRLSARFYDEDAAAYAARLDHECAASRALLERELGVPVELFAYPYGDAPPAARDAVARAGYRAAFTVRDTLAYDGDPLLVPRLDGLEAHALIAPSSSEPARFSVVVPACDRSELLAEVLRGWRAQSYPAERHEVLVVDDGSREDLRPLFAPEHKTPHIRLLRLDEGAADAFRAGQARQHGAREARFEHLAFLDADVRVGPHFLWHLDWVHRRVPDAALLGYLSGYNLHDLGFVHTREPFAALAPDEDPADHVALIPDRSREPTLRACLDNVDWLTEPWRLCYTGNLSVSRSLFERAGGFDLGYTGWGLEDLDLGLRLHRAGAQWVFSRFAVGYHLVDEAEQAAAPRNPFRRTNPQREHFASYLVNLDRLRERHRDEPAVERFALQSLRDIDETLSTPHTVGVELGGHCSLRCAHHRRLETCTPGGVLPHEALDRVAYAKKVGAKQLYLLGGESAEHPAFLALLRAGRAAGVRRIIAQSNGTPFADEPLAQRARDAGLDHVALKVYAFDRDTYEAVTRSPGSYARFERGLDALLRAGVYLSARVQLVDAATVARLEHTLDALADRSVELDAVSVLDPAWLEPTLARATRWAALRGLAPPRVRAVRA